MRNGEQRRARSLYGLKGRPLSWNGKAANVSTMMPVVNWFFTCCTLHLLNLVPPMCVKVDGTALTTYRKKSNCYTHNGPAQPSKALHEKCSKDCSRSEYNSLVKTIVNLINTIEITSSTGMVKTCMQALLHDAPCIQGATCSSTYKQIKKSSS